jgi:hypothetical protein
VIANAAHAMTVEEIVKYAVRDVPKTVGANVRIQKKS